MPYCPRCQFKVDSMDLICPECGFNPDVNSGDRDDDEEANDDLADEWEETDE